LLDRGKPIRHEQPRIGVWPFQPFRDEKVISGKSGIVLTSVPHDGENASQRRRLSLPEDTRKRMGGIAGRVVCRCIVFFVECVPVGIGSAMLLDQGEDRIRPVQGRALAQPVRER
jgi:hypothetical protein